MRRRPHIPAGDEPLRFAILGPGMVGEVHAAALARIADVRLVAVAGSRPGSPQAARLADAHGARPADGIDDLLADERLDAVIVCTPHPLHAGQVTWIGNSAPEVQFPMQQLVTRELTVRGAYGFVDEFELAADALAAGWIDARKLIECVAPLDEGEELFRQLAAGTLSAVKVVLAPNADR